MRLRMGCQAPTYSLFPIPGTEELDGNKPHGPRTIDDRTGRKGNGPCERGTAMGGDWLLSAAAPALSASCVRVERRDGTHSGWGPVKRLTVVDEYNREHLAIMMPRRLISRDRRGLE